MIRSARTEHSYYVRDAAQADLPAVLTMKAAAWREAYGHLRDEQFFRLAEATLDRQIEPVSYTHLTLPTIYSV